MGFYDKIWYNENLKIYYDGVAEHKKRCKNVLGAILFARDIIWCHTPKIVDQTEISDHPHLQKSKIYIGKDFMFKKILEPSFISMIFEVRTGRNFCVIDDFWDMTLIEGYHKKNHINIIFRAIFMCWSTFFVIFGFSKIIKFCWLNSLFHVPGVCTYSEWCI